MINKLCVNLLGSPSSGKTIVATSLFAKLKARHLDAVYVPEFAKECAVEGNPTIFENQLYIWATQQYRVFCAYRHSPITITDSPILLGALYNSTNSPLCELILAEHQKYNNLNVLLRLNTEFPYSMIGRVHSQEQSYEIDQNLQNFLEEHEIPFLNYDDFSEEDIIELVVSALHD
jgi:nicotinamide riboside kinase